MTGPVKIEFYPVPQDATQKQRIASDPALSSWVGASAGSGKTKVLTDRILRLLLPRENGEPATRPERILALTFTKAGANEMSLRLSQRLSRWAVMPETALIEDMEKNLLGRAPSPDELLSARKLFARVVDAPGGLNIMTIHSFCQSVLGRFPVEAGLPPHFRPLEEEEAVEILSRARADILKTAVRDRSSPFAHAVATISTALSEDQYQDILRLMVSERHQIADILSRSFGIDGLYTNLCRELDIQPGLTDELLFQEFSFLNEGQDKDLHAACALLASSANKTDRLMADSIQDFLDAALLDKASLYDYYRTNFVTTKNEPKTPTKSFLKSYPDVAVTFAEESARILAFDDARRAVRCARLTTDLFTLSDAIIQRYAALKNEQGALDFDDLILKTVSLLKGDYISASGERTSGWVMYKLDEGIEHILVDEAQDTNPEQWEIIRLLSEEFFAGYGAKDIARTLFVVGDEKQSIFSFQRAAPEKFGAMRRYFETLISEAGHTFRPVDINTSFRSVQIVLDTVDTVFKSLPGLSSLYLPHIANRMGQGGIVEIWPVFKTTATDAKESEEDEQMRFQGWLMPDKISENQTGASQMASKIGDVIKSWLDNGEKLHSYDRPIQPGDIMILVRARNAFVTQLVRALKTRSIPVSGVDRMVLSEQIVVQDLCAAASFALLPDDDLTLSCLLKSPLISYDDDRLYELAYGRTGTLWNAVRENADRAVVQWLDNLIERAGKDHPYEFFSRIIQEPCPAHSLSGLQAIRVRLGEDALDPLDEFLNTSLAFEGGHTAGLQSFLHWHGEVSGAIKREMEEAAQAVRIMTVHGSKGLQAPIVFLPDTIRNASSLKPEKILWPYKTSLSVPFYYPSKESAPLPVRNAATILSARADEEYRRLLYVAMTRAEERLYIGGYQGKKGPGNTLTWYADIRSALENAEGVERIPSGQSDDQGEEEHILRLKSDPAAPPDKANKVSADKVHSNITMPDWATRTRPEEPVPPRPLVPSRPSDPEPAAASPLQPANAFRFRRGIVTHKLLQILPQLPEMRRREAAAQYLARSAVDLPQDIRNDVLSEIFAILTDPVFAEIFGPDSLPEVPVTGLLDGVSLISGQIDRLLVREWDILIVDYKTNRPPPSLEENIPAIYRRQMKAYADALTKIYPGKKVRAALLWTDGARLMEISL